MSTGRLRSAMLAIVMHHLKVGAQKWMVKGPAGEAAMLVSIGEDLTEGMARKADCIRGTMDGRKDIFGFKKEEGVGCAGRVGSLDPARGLGALSVWGE